jgi:hypothetical protein
LWVCPSDFFVKGIGQPNEQAVQKGHQGECRRCDSHSHQVAERLFVACGIEHLAVLAFVLAFVALLCVFVPDFFVALPKIAGHKLFLSITVQKIMVINA